LGKRKTLLSSLFIETPSTPQFFQAFTSSLA
jgi:hypothetical protein